jgi:hypothetical protein
MTLSSGNSTVLISDIEGIIKLAQDLPDEISALSVWGNTLLNHRNAIVSP